MRFRSKSDGKDLSNDLDIFAEFLDDAEYRHLLMGIGRSLNHKGYVTESDDVRFSLELALLNLELFRIRYAGQLPGVPRELHEAVEFVSSVGQTIPHLSSRAQTKLRGQIVSGLKTNGLRPLQHEMRVAGTISRLGFEISFSDLEGTGGYDFLAERSGLAYEIEAKCLSTYTGQPIPPQDADKFFLELRRGFDRWKEQDKIPVLNIIAKGRLSPDQHYLQAIVEGCNIAAATRSSVTVHGDLTVEFLGAVPDAPLAKLKLAARFDSLESGTNVYVSDGAHKVVARLRSEQPSRFAKKLVATISDASKGQFTGTRPAVIWAQVDYMSPRGFDYLAHLEGQSSLFDAVASRVFRSPKRKHISQLAFSGGVYPIISNGSLISSFKRVIYDAPDEQFSAPMLLPGGKRQTGRSVAPIAKATVSLFRVIDAPPPSPVPIAAYDDLLARIASASEIFRSELIAVTLVDKANALTSVGRADEAIAVCDEVLDRYGLTTDPMLQEAVASALIAKGVALGHSEMAIGVYNEVIDRFGTVLDLPMQSKLANALFNKGNALGTMPTQENDAIAVYDEVVARFGDATDISTRGLVGRSLYNKGRTLCKLGRTDDGIAAYSDVVVRFGSSHHPLLEDLVAKSLVNISYVSSDPQAALLACETVLRRLEGVAEPALLEQVAKALANKGSILVRIGRNAEALSAFGDLLLQFEGTRHPQLRGFLATAYLGKNRALHNLGRHQEAITVCDAMLRCFQDATEPALLAQLATALASKLGDLIELGRYEESIEVSDELMRRFSDAAEPEVRHTLCVALRSKQRALEALGRYAGVVATFTQLCALGATKDLVEDQQLQGALAAAHASKASALRELGRIGDEIDTYQALFDRFSAENDEYVREIVMWGLHRQAIALKSIGRTEDATQVFDKIVALCRADEQKTFKKHALDAMVEKATMFVDCGRHRDAIATIDVLIGCSGSTIEHELDEVIATGIAERAHALAGINEYSEALTAYDVALSVLVHSVDPSRRIRGARAFLGKGNVLRCMGRLSEAVAAFDELANCYATDVGDHFCEHVAVALLNKADALANRLGSPTDQSLIEVLARSIILKGDFLATASRPQDAASAYDSVVDRFSHASSAVIQELIATAIYNKGVLLNQLQQRQGALEAYDALTGRFSSSSDVVILDFVARALINKASTLNELDRSDEALSTCNHLLELLDFKFGNDAHAAEFRVYALINRADCLTKLGRQQDALATLGLVLTGTETFDEPGMADLIAEARTKRDSLLRAGEEA